MILVKSYKHPPTKGKKERLADILYEEHLYLCKYGFIKRQNFDNSDEYYWVSNRELAIEISNNINQLVSSICSDDGYDEPIVRVSTIEFRRG